MTVADLIFELSHKPQDAEVIITIDELRKNFTVDQVLLVDGVVELVSEESCT